MFTKPARSAYSKSVHLTDLRTAELLLVSTVRLFVAVGSEPTVPVRDWRGGLKAAGVGREAGASFLSLFTFLAVTPRRPLDMRCLHCTTLGHDEALLLRMISLLQHNQCSEALEVLRDWLPPAAARMALLPAEGLAQALRTRGLIVPWRHIEAADDQHIALPYPDRGMALVQ